jgi:hypothetical protein
MLCLVGYGPIPFHATFVGTITSHHSYCKYGDQLAVYNGLFGRFDSKNAVYPLNDASVAAADTG